MCIGSAFLSIGGKRFSSATKPTDMEDSILLAVLKKSPFTLF